MCGEAGGGNRHKREWSLSITKVKVKVKVKVHGETYHLDALQLILVEIC